VLNVTRRAINRSQIVEENAHGGHDIAVIGERLAHAHKDDIRDLRRPSPTSSPSLAPIHAAPATPGRRFPSAQIAVESLLAVGKTCSPWRSPPDWRCIACRDRVRGYRLFRSLTSSMRSIHLRCRPSRLVRITICGTVIRRSRQAVCAKLLRRSSWWRNPRRAPIDPLHQLSSTKWLRAETRRNERLELRAGSPSRFTRSLDT